MLLSKLTHISKRDPLSLDVHTCACSAASHIVLIIGTRSVDYFSNKEYQQPSGIVYTTSLTRKKTVNFVGGLTATAGYDDRIQAGMPRICGYYPGNLSRHNVNTTSESAGCRTTQLPSPAVHA